MVHYGRVYLHTLVHYGRVIYTHCGALWLRLFTHTVVHYGRIIYTHCGALWPRYLHTLWCTMAAFIYTHCGALWLRLFTHARYVALYNDSHVDFSISKV